MSQTEDKPKVVILSAFNVPTLMYGAEQFAKAICDRLAGQFELYLVTVRWDRKLPSEEVTGGVRIRRVGTGVRSLDKLLYPLLSAWEVRKFEPEIVHAIMESYAGGALALLKYIYPQARRVLTLQSGDLDDEKKLSVFHIRAFLKTIHNSAHFVTAISTSLAARAERLGVSKDRIRVIPNGLDFSEVPAPLPEKIPGRVICVGRLSWEKAHSYTLDAWPEVLKEFPSARLVLVGEGNERPKIEDQIARLGLRDSVTLTGNLPHKQVLSELAQSEVFICPSLAEGLGNVFIEAQACGTPPIGTRVGGIPDVIQDGENGLLIAPKSSDEIAAAIIKLLKDRELAARLSARAAVTVKKFDWRNIIEQIDVLYKELLRK